jgi:hypothetical protein
MGERLGERRWERLCQRAPAGRYDAHTILGR